MRLLKGNYRGYNLELPKVRDLRPTPPSVRNEIFNNIGRKVAGAIVLDLFAGTGSLGFEALSRGAKTVDFVDLNESSCIKIHENLKALKLLGRGRVYQQSAERFIESTAKQQYDFVFFTPPYQNLHLFLIPKIKKFLQNGALLITELPPVHIEERIHNFDRHFRLLSYMNFGWSRISFLETVSDEAENN